MRIEDGDDLEDLSGAAEHSWVPPLTLIAAIASFPFGLLAGIPAVVGGIYLLSDGHSRSGGAAIALASVAIVPRLVFVLVFGGHAYVVPTGSMTPAIEPDDRILAVRDETPENGDIIALHPPSDERCGTQHPPRQSCPVSLDRPDSMIFIKRVVGVGGDEIKLVAGRIVRNGEVLDEPACPRGLTGRKCELPQSITVPLGQVFVVGDNLSASEDSRYWGPIPIDQIEGRVIARYYPFDRIGGVG